MGTGVIRGAGTGFAGGGATFGVTSFWDWIWVAGNAGFKLWVWITLDIGSTGWGADIEGAGFWGETGLLRQIQVMRWVHNPAAQSEFRERTRLRPRSKGQAGQWGNYPVARGRRVYRVEQPWQLYSSLGPRRRAGPTWIAEFGTFLAGLIWAGFWFIGGVDFGITGVAGCAGSGYLGFSHEGHS